VYQSMKCKSIVIKWESLAQVLRSRRAKATILDSPKCGVISLASYSSAVIRVPC
jgi:hypothetical protein